MKHLYRTLASLVVIGLLLGAVMPLTSTAGTGSPQAATSVPDEWLVGYRPGSRVGTDLRGMAQHMAPVMRTSGLAVARVRLAAEKAPTALAQLENNPDVIFVEPNGLVEGTWTPNDPYYNDPTKVYAPQQIRANLAWDLVRGSGSVMIALVDSGADLAHPDLVGIFWTNSGEVPGNGVDDDGNGYVDDVSGWNFVNGTNLPQDDLGHGTHVSGIAAAQTDNGIGIAGIAGGVKVLPVKVLDSNNQGTWANVAQGIIYATDMGARAINLSLGGSVPSSTIESAIQYARSHGVLVVASAGNGGASDPFYPAAYDGVLAVAATATGNVRWSLSNYGSYIDIAAPGATVYSTYWKSGSSTYYFLSGTSMAAPAVTGVAALVWSKNPALTADAVAGILTSTAQDLGDPGWDVYYGNGQVDAYAAVLAAEATLPANSSIGGQLWMDTNVDGQHQLNETTGIPGVTVQLRDLRTQAVTQIVTDNQGNYIFSGLRTGSYEVSVARPQGYVPTTSVTMSTTLGTGQAWAADFGFVAPTAVTVEALTVASRGRWLVIAWQVTMDGASLQWHVLRATSLAGPPVRITMQPVSGVQHGNGTWTYEFEDTNVAAGQSYWYWLQNTGTGDTFGPVQATAPGNQMAQIFVPYVTR